MKYKALIFDLDGTAIPNKHDGMPSLNVINALSKASESILVSAASGRPYSYAVQILRALHLTKPCILSGGTQLVDPQNGTIFWETQINAGSAAKIFDILDMFSTETYYSVPGKGEYRYGKNDARPKEVQIFFIHGINQSLVNELIKKFSDIPNVTPHIVNSWSRGNLDIHITPTGGTKRHALEILLNQNGIKPEEVIAVGDSGNDLPLFELAGLKIAMGNASEELKIKAHVVAPPVWEDGLAAIIDKYVL